jgi:hypothetical protein
MAVFTELKHPLGCGACGNQIAKNDTRNLWGYVANDGARCVHLLCSRCMSRALRSKAAHAEVVERIELRSAQAVTKGLPYLPTGAKTS